MNDLKASQKINTGIKDALPIIIGYLPIGTAYGVIARQMGLNSTEAILMSVIVFAGASQFMGVGMLAAGAGFVEIVMATFFLNLRHILMSSSLAPYLSKASNKFLFFGAFGVTDETYAVNITKFKKGTNDQRQFITVNYISYFAWVGGSIIGVIIGAALPEFLQASFNFALIAMFIGLLVIQINRRLEVVIIVVTAVISTVLYFNLAGIWNVILATIIGATIGVMLESWITK